MKKVICFSFSLLLILFSCKKEKEVPTATNKIQFGNTTADSVGYRNIIVKTSLTSTGGNEITQHGHCWSNSPEPTIEANKTSLGKISEPKDFESDISGLTDNTTYYIRAYFTYGNGTVYNDEINIKTIKTGTPHVTTDNISDLTLYSATCGGTVVNDSGYAVTARGVCWDTETNPIIDNCDGKTNDGEGLGEFNSEVKELDEGTNYFLRAYAINKNGTGYGEERQFSTIPLNLPTVETHNVSYITYNSATCGGNITDNGNGNVSVRGVCWNSTGNPTLENCDDFTDNGSGTGLFKSNLTNLQEKTEYYVCAYATNEKGTSYGQIKNFTTLELTLPTVETSSVTNITSTSAQCGGNVTNDGNGTVSARGVCWNTSGNPTLGNCVGYTEDGSGTGTFTSNLTQLDYQKTYYVTAYATNEKGTSYGEQIKSFTPLKPCGILTVEYGGQTYNTVLIGDQCWLKENLNIGTRINGSQEMQNNSTIEKYCYDDNESNCNEYGGLYQWDEMMQYTTQEGTQGICPDGWHIPTDEEWKILEGNVDSQYGVGSSEWDETGYRGYDAGYNLKSETGWNLGGNGEDKYNFTALPGGSRFSNGYFGYVGNTAYFWSSSEYNADYAWLRRLSYDSNGVYRTYSSRDYGRSVRCLRD